MRWVDPVQRQNPSFCHTRSDSWQSPSLSSFCFCFDFFFALPEATLLCVSWLLITLEREAAVSGDQRRSSLHSLGPVLFGASRPECRRHRRPSRTRSVIGDLRSRSWRRRTPVQFRFTSSVEEKKIPTGSSCQGNLRPRLRRWRFSFHFLTCAACCDTAQFPRGAFTRMR